jgi:hypothetical protein
MLCLVSIVKYNNNNNNNNNNKNMDEKRRRKKELTCNLYHITSAGGLLVPECIIHPVLSVSILTWFIRYIVPYSSYVMQLFKTKVVFPQAQVTLPDFGYPV